MERWLECAEGYEVSDLGNVRSLDRTVVRRNGSAYTVQGKQLTPNITLTGYARVSLGKGNLHLVHHLVAAAFIGPRPDGHDVCHNDGDRLNNAAANLRYDTRRGNLLDKRKHGTDHNIGKTHCPHGHPYDATNTYVMPSGSRACRTCASRRVREFYARARQHGDRSGAK